MPVLMRCVRLDLHVPQSSIDFDLCAHVFMQTGGIANRPHFAAFVMQTAGCDSVSGTARLCVLLMRMRACIYSDSGRQHATQNDNIVTRSRYTAAHHCQTAAARGDALSHTVAHCRRSSQSVAATVTAGRRHVRLRHTLDDVGRGCSVGGGGRHPDEDQRPGV